MAASDAMSATGPARDTPFTASPPAPMPYAVSAGILSVSAVVCVLIMTAWGIGTSPDSIGYLQAARSITSSGAAAALGGEASGAQALTHFGPLYSFMLAAGGLAGLDALTWGRWLNAFTFGANVLLMSVLLRSVSGGAWWVWGLGTVLALASAPLLTLHITMLSEPGFLLFTFLGFWLLASYLETRASTALVLSALMLGLAWLTRYAGAASILAAGLALLSFPGRPAGRRLRDAITFGLVSGAGMLVWLARNAAVSNSATGRELVFHPIDRTYLWQAFYTASGWILVPASAPNWVRLGLWIAVAAVAAWALASAFRPAPGPSRPPFGTRESIPVLIRLLALFVVTYMAFLALSISFFDANTSLDDRILSPVYFAGIVLGLWLIRVIWGLLSTRPGAARLVMASLVLITGLQVVNALGLIAASHARGWGFSSRSWQSSPTLNRIRQLPDDVRVFSNAPELVYLHTGRQAAPLPRPWSAMNRRPDPAYPAEMSALQAVLSHESAVVVYFNDIRGGAPAPGDASAISTTPPLHVWDRQADGLILCAAVCPE